MTKASYAREERLRSRKTIARLFEEGRSVSAYPVRFLWIEQEPGGRFPVQVGVAVPRRNFRKAVDRNRLKRCMRESYRKQKELLTGAVETEGRGLAGLFMYTGREMASQAVIAQKIIVILNRFLKAYHEQRNINPEK